MQQTTSLTLIAQTFEAWQNCKASNQQEWLERHEQTIKDVCDLVMPHGSGLDGKNIKLDFERSKADKLVFVNLDYHHMNDNGVYCRWTDHNAIITPSLAHEFNLQITGTNKNDIKEYLTDCMHEALTVKLTYSQHEERWMRLDHVLHYLGLGIQQSAGTEAISQ